MKTLIFLIFALTTLFSINSYADRNACWRTGAITECGEGTLDQLHVAGKARLSGTKVLGATDIAGLLDAINVNLFTLNVAGKAEIINSTITGVVKISGILRSCGNHFSQDITIASDTTHLDNTKTRDIEINAGGSNQTIYISNRTLINGDINFLAGNGLVVIDSSSKINGRIYGGTIIKKEFQQTCTMEKVDD